MFVQYQVPAEQVHPYPLVMIHGGGQTGAGFLSTPDGRRGWADYFVARGFAVYVVDVPGRGRAQGHDAGDGTLRPAHAVARRVSDTTGDPLWPHPNLGGRRTDRSGGVRRRVGPGTFREGAMAGPGGITQARLTYVPPVGSPDELTFVRQRESDSPDLARYWLQAEPARQLPNLARVRMAIVTGEASSD